MAHTPTLPETPIGTRARSQYYPLSGPRVLEPEGIPGPSGALCLKRLRFSGCQQGPCGGNLVRSAKHLRRRSAMNHSATIRALLIEDSLGDALRVIQRLAQGADAHDQIEVERATTLQRGLDLLGKGCTDVVLLDLHLPDSAGAETVRRVREAHPLMPIVVF